MRIISGIYKGRKISIPKGIRPTRDNVKESVFNILSSRIKNARILDLFSGSGSLGIEALSRSAKEVVFVDNSKACTDIIGHNVLKLSHDSSLASVRIITKDSCAGIKILHNEGKQFDIIFIDPPYNKGSLRSGLDNGQFTEQNWQRQPQFYKNRIRKCLKYISVYDILCHSGLAVVEHFKKDIAPEQSEGMVLFRQIRYGDTLISIYQKKEKDD
jgi:16S rRNA (guanine966-N2)-methyltransferase